MLTYTATGFVYDSVSDFVDRSSKSWSNHWFPDKCRSPRLVISDCNSILFTAKNCISQDEFVDDWAVRNVTIREPQGSVAHVLFFTQRDENGTKIQKNDATIISHYQCDETNR
jgi:hypothetical protein